MEQPADPLPPTPGAQRRAAQIATPRMQREIETMAAMLRIYCRDHGHEAGAAGLCAECGGLLDYARKRLACCPYGADKPTCARCPVHCYGPRQREQARVVMRHAGPRMLLRHPLLAMGHLLDGRRPLPPDPRPAATARAQEARAAAAVRPPVSATPTQPAQTSDRAEA